MTPSSLTATRRIDRGDYILVRVLGHPKGGKDGYIYEHRFVMEQAVGRFLKSSEFVHHRNANKKDNHLSNLEITSPSEHSRRHKEKPKKVFKCTRCRKKVYRTAAQSLNRGTKDFYCSRKCRRAPHGTDSRYVRGCRCVRCRKAHREWARGYRKQQRTGS